MNIAIIPARGGSKRIPRKNIKLFNGKPIIAYSIESAIKSQCFDRVIISTDDKEIAEIAIQYGAEVPFMRPAHIADDYATTLDVMHHAVTQLDQEEHFENVCCIYATAPFVTPGQLREGIRLLKAESADYVFPIAEFTSPIQRALLRDSKGFLSMTVPEHLNSRSQDLREAYYDTGQFYWGKVSAFLNNTSIYSDKSLGLRLGKYSCVDIDDLEDWAIAEFLYDYRASQ
ncbi:pseudaminic acid cytidylyltransferase [Alginatibacterium sediminis]|uniref:Pseudaminic acid cytidylyltransferase n=1 Tax=Alginatibacterium sediminis TaxID=2164068 RepID=A0A420EG15_9ALTE|nr:pseudaminic acid cytidylyltransferase [Alginatibacterium sediminis]RKF19649.1 pseudaminic acid cytidylyltransferase [Alginatibacterium sediminis]